MNETIDGSTLGSHELTLSELLCTCADGIRRRMKEGGQAIPSERHPASRSDPDRNRVLILTQWWQSALFQFWFTRIIVSSRCLMSSPAYDGILSTLNVKYKPHLG